MEITPETCTEPQLPVWIVPSPTKPTPNAVPLTLGRLYAPRGYRHSRDQARTVDPKVTGPWPNPRTFWLPDGSTWHEVPFFRGGSRYTHLGWVLSPRTRLGRIFFHIAHGRMMGYPWGAVLRFVFDPQMWQLWNYSGVLEQLTPEDHIRQWGGVPEPFNREALLGERDLWSQGMPDE